MTNQPTPDDAAERPAPAMLDLDSLEREGAAEPFTFQLAGKRFLMSDPRDVDWQDLLVSLSSPQVFFRLVLPPEDHQSFFGSRLPGWKMQTLMTRYQQHYGIPDAGEAVGSAR